jgi:hypothetical protein
LSQTQNGVKEEIDGREDIKQSGERYHLEPRRDPPVGEEIPG